MNNKTADMYQRHWRERVRVSKAGHKGDVVPGSEIFEAAASALNGGGTLLDVGCGDGSFYPCISAKFEHVYGIDIAPEAVNEAQERGMEAVAGDAGGPLPWKDRYFNSIVCLEVIEHLPDPLAALKEIHRVLKPGGHLVLTTPNIRYFRNLARLLFAGEFPRTSTDNFVWGGGHMHYFTRKDIKGLFEAASFTGISFYLNCWQFKRSWKRRLARRLVGEKFFGEYFDGSITVLAYKGD